MALPPGGWTTAPERAPFVDVPLPEREEFTYVTYEDHPPLIDQWELPLAKLEWGAAGADAAEGYTEDNDLVRAATLWVDSAYAVTMIDAFLLAAPLEKGWLFTLDGHVFYALNFVLGRSLIYDFTTGQWHKWYTEGRPFWNVFRGINWNGVAVGADAEGPQVWAVDPLSHTDNGVEVARVVSGFQPAEGPDSSQVGALRLTARGAGAEERTTVQLRFSDDGGRTWSRFYTRELLGNRPHRIEFRSLGRVRAPGRLWEIHDAGGLVRIDGIDVDMGAGD